MASTAGPLYRAQPIDLLRPPSPHQQSRDLPPYDGLTSADDGGLHLLSQESLRLSSTTPQPPSLQHNASVPQLPGLSTLASVASGRDSPQPRAFSVGSGTAFAYAMSSPSATTGGGLGGTSPPTCQNCSTSTTPLWRRDESGQVLCNACGLFLKLHGRARPLSLKTEVIKSRNRVKTSGQGQGQKKKSLFDTNNGLIDANSLPGTPHAGSLGHRRASQKSQNGHSDGSHSPISRTGTPAMYANHTSQLPPYDPNSMIDPAFNSPSLATMHLRQSSPGRSESSLNGERNMDVPQTFEQLLAANASLKTRVSELEVINELFRGRVTQLEQDEANARRGEEMRRTSEAALRVLLEDSQRRENQLKHRLDDVERELNDLRDSTGPPAKKMKMADMTGDDESEIKEETAQTTDTTEPPQDSA